MTWWPSVAPGMASGTTGRAGEAFPLDVLFALRAVIAVDGVLGDDGRDPLGDVRDRAGAGAALDLAAAVGAVREAVFDAAVDRGRGFLPRRSTATWPVRRT